MCGPNATNLLYEYLCIHRDHQYRVQSMWDTFCGYTNDTTGLRDAWESYSGLSPVFMNETLTEVKNDPSLETLILGVFLMPLLIAALAVCVLTAIGCCRRGGGSRPRTTTAREGEVPAAHRGSPPG